MEDENQGADWWQEQNLNEERMWVCLLCHEEFDRKIGHRLHFTEMEEEDE